MRDGSDAIADWPMLNALLNASSGATWVSVHHGGGVGIGYSLHAGMVIVADGIARGRREARARADAATPAWAWCGMPTPGIPEAIAAAERHGLRLPMRDATTPP